MSQTPFAASEAGPPVVLAEADALAAQGRALDAIDLLVRANREQRNPMIDRRLLELRHTAFDELRPVSAFAEWPVPGRVPVGDGGPHIPQVPPAEMSGEVVRDQLMAHGAVGIPGLLSPEQVARCVQGIEDALAARELGPAAEARATDSRFRSLPLPREQAFSLGRHWVAGAGGVLACDAPQMAFDVLEIYEEVGLRRVVTDYLGERPALSGNKWTLRRVPTTANTDWHQDGAFLGDGLRALNVWVALTDCGDDAPGMDLLPRRLDGLVETGTGGAIFDWAVGPAVVEGLAVESPVVRPLFRAGDALLFDELFLHRSAVDPSMARERFAIESWFFAPSAYPEGQVPIVW